MVYPEAYIEYLMYFHGNRDYFECHEVLEEYWKEVSPRTFMLKNDWEKSEEYKQAFEKYKEWGNGVWAFYRVEPFHLSREFRNARLAYRRRINGCPFENTFIEFSTRGHSEQFRHGPCGSVTFQTSHSTRTEN